MKSFVIGVARVLDRVALRLCHLSAALLVGLVLAIVVLRYGFDTGFIRLQDGATYAFAMLAAFSVPVCLARDGHVRVEVFSERWPALWRGRVEAGGLLLFLIPVFGLMIWAWWPQMVYSWSIREASLETGGLPGLWLMKTLPVIAAALTILQGVAAVLRGRA